MNLSTGLSVITVFITIMIITPTLPQYVRGEVNNPHRLTDYVSEP